MSALHTATTIAWIQTRENGIRAQFTLFNLSLDGNTEININFIGGTGGTSQLEAFTDFLTAATGVNESWGVDNRSCTREFVLHFFGGYIPIEERKGTTAPAA